MTLPCRKRFAYPEHGTDVALEILLRTLSHVCREGSLRTLFLAHPFAGYAASEYRDAMKQHPPYMTFHAPTSVEVALKLFATLLYAFAARPSAEELANFAEHWSLHKRPLALWVRKVRSMWCSVIKPVAPPGLVWWSWLRQHILMPWREIPEIPLHIALQATARHDGLDPTVIAQPRFKLHSDRAGNAGLSRRDIGVLASYRDHEPGASALVLQGWHNPISVMAYVVFSAGKPVDPPSPATRSYMSGRMSCAPQCLPAALWRYCFAFIGTWTCSDFARLGRVCHHWLWMLSTGMMAQGSVTLKLPHNKLLYRGHVMVQHWLSQTTHLCVDQCSWVMWAILPRLRALTSFSVHAVVCDLATRELSLQTLHALQPQLEELSLLRITDMREALLQPLTSLRRLQVAHCEWFTGAELGGCTALQSLSVHNCGDLVTDHLPHWSQLESLTLLKQPFHESTPATLPLPLLTSLTMNACVGASMTFFVECRDLRELVLTACTQISTPSIATFTRLRRLCVRADDSLVGQPYNAAWSGLTQLRDLELYIPFQRCPPTAFDKLRYLTRLHIRGQQEPLCDALVSFLELTTVEDLTIDVAACFGRQLLFSTIPLSPTIQTLTIGQKSWVRIILYWRGASVFVRKDQLESVFNSPNLVICVE